jgi:hypothetical protein
MKDRKLMLMCLLMGLIGGFLVPMVFAWTYTYNIATPADSDSPTEGDDRIREIKQAVQELMNVCGFWPLNGNDVNDVDAGKYRFIIIQGPNTIAAVDPCEGVFHTKNVEGIPEGHFTDQAESATQITKNGHLYVVTASLDANCVTSAKIGDANVGTTDLADSAVTAAKIADANVLTADLGPNSVTSVKLAPDTIIASDVNNIFGTWTANDSGSNAIAKDEIYQAGSDGILIVNGSTYSSSKALSVKTDSGASPSTTVASPTAGHSSDKPSLTVPIKKDHYLQILGDGTPTAYWLPIGSGSLVKQ